MNRPAVYPMMKRIGIVLAACLLFAGCSKKQEAKPAQKPAGSGNPLTAPVDYLGAVSKAQQTAVKVTDLASLNQAIQNFYFQEDRYPKDLNELVSQRYLARLPAPPTGKKFAYNPQTGQLSLVPQ